MSGERKICIYRTIYTHILDMTTNVIKVLIGPKYYYLQENEKQILTASMIRVLPGHYCIVGNPVQKDANGEVVYKRNGEAKLRYGKKEVRFTQEIFPLYPGEHLVTDVTKFEDVESNTALRLKAIKDFVDEDGKNKLAGEEWLFNGPGIYIPRIEVKVLETTYSMLVLHNEALRLRAKKDLTDREGNHRFMGEQWLVERPGAYLPGAYEEVVKTEKAYDLDGKRKALHVKALMTFTDEYGTSRRNGDEWLMQSTDRINYIPKVCEEVVGVVRITKLNRRQYCIILNPVDDKGNPQLGNKKLVKGPMTFFLQPGESLEKGVQNIFILEKNEGLILKAHEEFMDKDQEDKSVKRMPGDKWMIRGPARYIPPEQVEVVTKRTAIPLDVDEGIYVWNLETGEVRSVIGHTYMLDLDEELFFKKLSSSMENLIHQDWDPLDIENEHENKSAGETSRDDSKVKVLSLPEKAIARIYDYKGKKTRIILGPDHVMLGPGEQFTPLKFSGRNSEILRRSSYLPLGPDFMDFSINVETANHFSLKLLLSCDWQFEVEDFKSETETSKLFSIPDFLGHARKTIASRIRGGVAASQFDDLDIENCNSRVRLAVFGMDENKKLKESFKFIENGLVITSIRVKEITEVDHSVSEDFPKEIHLAVDFPTKSQEATVSYGRGSVEETRGRLERQNIDDARAQGLSHSGRGRKRKMSSDIADILES